MEPTSSTNGTSPKRSGIPKLSLFQNGTKGPDSKTSPKLSAEMDNHFYLLMEKTAETLERSNQLDRENKELKEKLEKMEIYSKSLEDKLAEVYTKSLSISSGNSSMKNEIDEKQMEIDMLNEQLQTQKEYYEKLLYSNNKILKRLAEIVPSMDQSIHPQQQKLTNLTTDEIESKINQYFTSTDLQLYEAQEKIHELLEAKTSMEEDLKNLRLDNEKLAKVGKLMSTNYRETLDTNLLMEEKIRSLQTVQKDLVKKSRDSIDSPKIFNTNEEIQRLNEKLNRSEVAYERKISEMKKQMEEAIEKDTNEQINILKIKLELMETELTIALKRAEDAEQELLNLKRITQVDSDKSNKNIINTVSVAPPPPPPPLPPPPPPLPPTYSQNSGSPILKIKRNPALTIQQQMQQQLPQQTGMIDQIVSEMKSGRVTLRKRRPGAKHDKNNPLLEEMFLLLEKSRKQNRNSKIIIDNEISPYACGDLDQF